METIPTIESPEESLDPQDWEALAALGHRMVDDLVASWRGVRERPAWQPIPAGVKAALNEPLPRQPQAPEAIYAQFQRDVMPYPTGNTHPRFWGWVMGTGTPLAAFADLLAAGMNANTSGFEDSATLVETQVIAWCRELFGFPEGATGLLVSGASMANLVGLAVARQARAGFDVRAQGLGRAPARLVLYASRETHNSVRKATELLGLGSDALRLLPVDVQGRVALDLLSATLAADRAAGLHPFCVVGNAGTVNTGAIDDLAALADLCAREQLWLHVDGAFGALAALSPELRPRLRGLERADSLAFDFHKWGYVPYEAACVLVRRAEDQRRAFALEAPYLNALAGGVAPVGPRFTHYGPQLSRGFRALKVWMTFKEHGADKLGRLIRQNVAQAAYLAERVRANPELELLAPATLNIVCFRYAGDVPAGALDALNAALLVELQTSGLAVPSSTVLDGRFALRVAITNHRSRRADFDLLVQAVLSTGRALAARGLDSATTGPSPATALQHG
jgi:glutamate/tyrosine decarboxylase-like PLP-dependent enzyme